MGERGIFPLEKEVSAPWRNYSFSFTQIDIIYGVFDSPLDDIVALQESASTMREPQNQLMNLWPPRMVLRLAFFAYLPQL